MLNDINKAKTIIRQLYQHNWVFKLRDIKEKINNMIHNSGHPKIDDLYILYALIICKRKIRNFRLLWSSRIFNLYTSDKISYYVFQPNELNDQVSQYELRDTPTSQLKIKQFCRNLKIF